jgi:hypothetical protein
MDASSVSARVSEESEGGRIFAVKENDSSRLHKGKPEKLGGYGSISPDGAESSTDDDEKALPIVRVRNERQPLLNAENTLRAQAAPATSVLPARSPGLPATSSPPDKSSSALKQALVDSPKQRPATRQQPRESLRRTPKKKLSDSCVDSSLVSSSSEDERPSRFPKKILPTHKRPDWRKPVDHHISDAVQRLNVDGSPSIPPAPSPHDFMTIKQVFLPPTREGKKPVPESRHLKVLRKYAVEAPFKRITSEGPVQSKKRPATTSELREIKSMMRERALNKYKATDGTNRFELLFTGKRYAHIDDRSKINGFFGDVRPIISKHTSDLQQTRYYNEVRRLYELNMSQEDRYLLVKKDGALNQLRTKEEKNNARFQDLEDFMWKLTPNQRHGLREKFQGLYGNSVLRDDTNWMFLDTIIRSYTMDDAEQRTLMNDISSATENRLPIIHKLCNILAGLSTRKISSLAELRLHKRDELCSKIQGLLTQKQRDEIKRVCKERHNSILYSRLPLLQVIIMENNQEALEDYENAVLRFMHGSEFFRLFDCRSRTLGANPTFDGDGAFFTMAQFGSIDMMLHFLSFILTNVTLSGKEKLLILKSFRTSDDACAFHMVMAAGDYERAKAVLKHFNLLAQQLENWFGIPEIKRSGPPFTSFDYSESTAEICATVISGMMDDLSRTTRITNGYTRAIEHGHIKCAKMFRRRLRYNWKFYLDGNRKTSTDYQKIKYKPNGEKFDKDLLKIAKKAEKTKANNIKQKIRLYPDENKRKENLAKLEEKFRISDETSAKHLANQKRIKDNREKAIRNNRPISIERTQSEINKAGAEWTHAKCIGAKAILTYTTMDDITGVFNRRELKKQKRKENPTPFQSAIKAVTPLFTPKDTGTPKSETKPRRIPKYIARPEEFTPSKFIDNRLPKNSDGSPKPRIGAWEGERYELKKLKRQAKQGGSAPSGSQGYAKFEDESEGG